MVGVAATPDNGGYWEVAANGAVAAFGDATNYGSMAGQHLNAPIVGIAATQDGGGYWLVASDGGIFNFGDAPFAGSMGGHHLNAPIVGIAGTPDGAGYWQVASDGGIFSFGDAVFAGSMGGQHLNAPIVGIAASPGAVNPNTGAFVQRRVLARGVRRWRVHLRPGRILRLDGRTTPQQAHRRHLRQPRRPQPEELHPG